MPTVVPAEAAQIERAARTLRAGGIVAFPTETVYGLGAIAFDVSAVARVFEAKRRPSFDPLIVHVVGTDMLRIVAADIDPLAQVLIERFWPGPLTIVFPKTLAVPDLVTAGLQTVAVRQPAHPVAAALIAAVDAPLAAPSANKFGAISSTTAQHVARELGEDVDLILDGGPAPLGLESTIVTATGGRITLLRHGAIALETLEVVAGAIDVAVAASRDTSQETSRPVAPGQLQSHYAPRTPLRIVAPDGVAAAERANAGLLAFSEATDGYATVRVLSPTRNLREAATRFFAALHDLDALGLARIDAEPVPETGLGRAIMDRLRRASSLTR